MVDPDLGEQKLEYARQLHQEGVTAPAKIQQAVKKKFGTGMNFRDLGKIDPTREAKEKVAGKRGPGRPPKAATGKRGPGRPPKAATGKRGPGRPPKATAGKRGPGRPKGWSSGQWLLLVGGSAEVFGGQRALEGRVAELVAAGQNPGTMAVYEKVTMELTLTTSVTL